MKIIAFAYACDPLQGSEPAAGWIWSRMLAGLGETWVLTRKNNRAAIESALPGIPERERLHFVYVDLPRWARWWKRGQRGIRAYYLLWQFVSLKVARQLHREQRFDLAWHLTLANVWLGSVAPLVGPPSVIGPVGGGVGVPWRFLPYLGSRGIGLELIRLLGRSFGRYLNPLARVMWRRASLILVQNRETRDWLPEKYRTRAAICPHAVTDMPPNSANPTPKLRVALFAGRLLPWKGAALAVHAIAALPSWRLLICGGGPDENRLRKLISSMGMGDRVEFRGRLSRKDLLDCMKIEAAVLLFPSLHDDSPFVVAEATTVGLPTVCLDRGGPPLLVGDSRGVVSATGRAAGVVQSLSEAVEAVYSHPPGRTASLGMPTVRIKLQQLIEPVLGKLGITIGKLPVADEKSSSVVSRTRLDIREMQRADSKDR